MLLFVLDTGVGTVWVQSGEVAKSGKRVRSSFRIDDKQVCVLTSSRVVTRVLSAEADLTISPSQRCVVSEAKAWQRLGVDLGVGAPGKRAPIQPHAMHDDRELTRQSDAGMVQAAVSGNFLCICCDLT